MFFSLLASRCQIVSIVGIQYRARNGRVWGIDPGFLAGSSWQDEVRRLVGTMGVRAPAVLGELAVVPRRAQHHNTR